MILAVLYYVYIVYCKKVYHHILHKRKMDATVV